MSEQVTLIPNNSLITNTPEEAGNWLLKWLGLIIKITQPDPEIREQYVLNMQMMPLC